MTAQVQTLLPNILRATYHSCN